MKRILCLIFSLIFLISVTSCGEKTVSADDIVMLAYEGNTPATEFALNFPTDLAEETIKAYLASYDPIVVHKGETITFALDGAVSNVDAFRVCYMDEDGNEVKHQGIATLDANAFSDDLVEIGTDWWYDDPEFVGQYTTWAYWIAVSLPNEENSTRIYYLRVEFA